MKLNIRTLAALAMLVSVSIILTRMFSWLLPVGGAMTVRLSFGEIPIMLAGILFGPFAGALTGIAADLLGYMLNSAGLAYFPGFTLSAGLTGLIPGLLLRNSAKELTVWRLFWAILVTEVIVSVVLNTLWLTIMYKVGVLAILPARILARALLLPVYTIVIHTITSRSFMVALRERQA